MYCASGICYIYINIFHFTDFLCVSVFACLSQSALCNQWEIKFFFHCKRAWLIWQWRVDTYSTRPCQRCLWPSGKIINHPKSPPAFLASPLSNSTVLHRSCFSRSSVFFKHHSFSHFLVFLSFGNAQLFLASLSFFQTHMLTEDVRTRTFLQNDITHSTAWTSLTFGGHGQWVCVFVFTDRGCEMIVSAHIGWAFWWGPN